MIRVHGRVFSGTFVDWFMAFNTYSQLSLSRSFGTIFYKFKLFGLVKKGPTPNYGWKKQSKCIIDSDKRFEFRLIRDIRVRDSESRLYIPDVGGGPTCTVTLTWSAQFLPLFCGSDL